MPQYDVSYSYREELSEMVFANSFAEVEKELSANYENVKIR